MVVTVVPTVVVLIIPALTQDIVIPATTQGTVMPLTIAQAVMALAATQTAVQSLIMAPCLAVFLVEIMTITAVPAKVPSMTTKTPSMATETPSMTQTRTLTATTVF